MEVVRIKKNNKLGILVIPEKLIKSDNTYSLNTILTEDNELITLFSGEFEKIGEVDDD